MSEQTRIHETVIKDVIDVMTDLKDSGLTKLAGRQDSFKSIADASKNLILVFPVITSNNIDINTASMIAKAQERQAVSMLQILFSAIDCVNADETVMSYLRRFHTNLGNGATLSIDQFMDAMDSLGESVSYNIPEEEVNKIKNDLRNLNFYLEEDYNDITLNNYSITETSYEYIVEEKTPKKDYSKERYELDKDKFEYQREKDELDRAYRKDRDDIEDLNTLRKIATDKAKLDNDSDRLQNDIDKFAYQKDKDREDASFKAIQNRLIDNDVRKANELIPTLMVIRINTIRSDSIATVSNIVVGVKAKIYSVESAEIVNRLINKSKDNNWLLNLVKATTREISFFKDFVFAIDKAKIDAKNTTAKGSTAKIFKLLERRSSRSKLMRALGMKNSAIAISTIHISKEEVDLVKKLGNIDLTNSATINRLMASFNLMSFVYTDESTETAHFIYDSGDDKYEVLSYNSLERDNGSMDTKKLINLMSKVSR